jgi:hypothetical protein
VDVGADAELNEPPPRLRTMEFDTFSASVGLAWIAGGLALVVPFLDSLVAALAALAVAGWVVDHRHGRTGAAARGPLAGGLPWSALAVGVSAFFLLPSPWGTGRGLILALSLLPLWLAERRRIPGPTPVHRSRP